MTRPDTDLGVMAAAIHRDMHPDHEGPTCCIWFERDVQEAQRLITDLAHFGAHVAFDVHLPKEAPRGREGTLDLTRINGRVLDILTIGPMSTWAICTIYQQRSDDRMPGYPKRAFDTPRKRLADLDRAGYARQTGETVKHHGVSYGVWEITDAGRRAISAEAAAA